MSFICVICRDLLKISEGSSPRHNQHLSTNTGLANHHVSSSPPRSPSSPARNNVSSGRKKEKNNSIVATKCGHLFHYPCLSVWLSQSVNLTTDSKMRCPSCKQLIYIYELVQLFPVENYGGSNGCSNSSDHAFQQKINCMMEQLEKLVRDLGKTSNNGSPTKGNETPTRLQRIRDSPKKVNAAQWAEIVKGFDSLRVSMKELDSFMEHHAELGSTVERQAKEISELQSKNEQLLLANEKLTTLKNDNVEDANKTTLLPTERERNDDSDYASTTSTATTLSSQNDCVDIIINAKEAQVFDSLMETPTPQLTPSLFDESNSKKGISNKKERRNSVRFADPFDEFDEIPTPVVNNGNRKDLRVGDKVVWSFEGSLEVGTVKWKGFIGSQINVGVEFERQLGLPIKDLSTDAIQCIFKSKPGHGRIIPVNEVILYHKSLFRDNPNLTACNNSDCVHSDYKSNGGLNKRFQVCAHQ